MSENISFKIITNLDDAEKLWRQFSPNINIYDAWDFRSLIYRYYRNTLHFIVAYINDAPIGVLPLQFKKDSEILEFFGGTYMEDNKVLIKPGYEQFIPQFYSAVNKPAQLEYITGQDDYTSSFALCDYKYVLPLEGINGYEDFFRQYYDAEKRGKERRKIRKVEKEKVEIIQNDFTDIESLITLNINNFEETSIFNVRPFFKEVFRELLNLPYQIFLTSFRINNQLEAVSLAILYRDYYEYFNLGVNKEIKGLTTFVHIKNMEQAIGAKAKYFDAFVGDYGWKELWRLPKIPQYKFLVPTQG